VLCQLLAGNTLACRPRLGVRLMLQYRANVMNQPCVDLITGQGSGAFQLPHCFPPLFVAARNAFQPRLGSRMPCFEPALDGVSPRNEPIPRNRPQEGMVDSR